MATKDTNEYKKKLRSHGLQRVQVTRDKQSEELKTLLKDAEPLFDVQLFGNAAYLNDLGTKEAKLRNNAARYETQHNLVQEMLADMHKTTGTNEKQALNELVADDNAYTPVLYEVQDMLDRLSLIREEFRHWAKGEAERDGQKELTQVELKKQKDLAEAEVQRQKDLANAEVKRQQDLAQKEVELKDQEMQLKEREMKMRETAAAAGTPIPVVTPSGNTSKNVKLPKLEIASFSGDIETWPSFRDTFKSTFEGLHNLDKLKYLKSSVKGNALSAIEGFPDTANNFTIAWEKLERDFGDEQAIKRSLIRSIKRLQLPNTTTPSLRQFLNGLETNIERLKALGMVVDTDVSLWDDVEATMTTASVSFFQQLDQQRLQKVPPPEWSMSVLIELLGNHVRVREQLEHSSQTLQNHDELEVPESSAQALFAKSGNKSRNFEYDSHRGNAKNPLRKTIPGLAPFVVNIPTLIDVGGTPRLNNEYDVQKSWGYVKYASKVIPNVNVNAGPKTRLVIIVNEKVIIRLYVAKSSLSPKKQR